MTLLIAGYVLYQGFTELPKVIHLLMEGTPEHIDIQEVIKAIEDQDGVKNAHHVHVWQLDEQRNALEAHVVLSDVADMDAVKVAIKPMLHDKFHIDHSTLEFENISCCD